MKSPNLGLILLWCVFLAGFSTAAVEMVHSKKYVAAPDGSVAIYYRVASLLLAVCCLVGVVAVPASLLKPLWPAPAASESYVNHLARAMASDANTLPVPVSSGRVHAEERRAWWYANAHVVNNAGTEIGATLRTASSSPTLDAFQVTYQEQRKFHACVDYSAVSKSWSASTGRCSSHQATT